MFSLLSNSIGLYFPLREKLFTLLMYSMSAEPHSVHSISDSRNDESFYTVRKKKTRSRVGTPNYYHRRSSSSGPKGNHYSHGLPVFYDVYM